MSGPHEDNAPAPVPENLRSPLQADDMERGFRVARNVVRLAAAFFILLAIGVLVETDGTFYPALLIPIVVIPVYVTTVTRMRAHFDRASREIAARRPEDLRPGDFRDEDEGDGF